MENVNFELVGQKMQKLRKKKGYTQEYVAEKLGVTVPFISNIENNKTKLNLRVLLYYAKLLNVSVDYLLSTEATDRLSDLLTDEKGDKPNGQTQQILRLLENFTEEEKEKLINILEIIKE